MCRKSDSILNVSFILTDIIINVFSFYNNDIPVTNTLVNYIHCLPQTAQRYRNSQFSSFIYRNISYVKSKIKIRKKPLESGVETYQINRERLYQAMDDLYMPPKLTSYISAYVDAENNSTTTKLKEEFWLVIEAITGWINILIQDY